MGFKLSNLPRAAKALECAVKTDAKGCEQKPDPFVDTSKATVVGPGWSPEKLKRDPVVWTANKVGPVLEALLTSPDQPSFKK